MLQLHAPGTAAITAASSDDRSVGTNIPFVMRYHPILKHAFRRALQHCPIPKELDISIMPAWKNATPSIASHISHCTRNAIAGRVGGPEGILCVSRDDAHNTLPS